eukprot:2555590-Pleurochrysis_carterae.AAC.2
MRKHIHGCAHKLNGTRRGKHVTKRCGASMSNSSATCEFSHRVVELSSPFIEDRLLDGSRNVQQRIAKAKDLLCGGHFSICDRNQNRWCPKSSIT